MLSMVYLIEEFGLEVTVSMELIAGASIIRQINRVKNIGARAAHADPFFLYVRHGNRLRRTEKMV